MNNDADSAAVVCAYTLENRKYIPGLTGFMVHLSFPFLKCE